LTHSVDNWGLCGGGGLGGGWDLSCGGGGVAGNHGDDERSWLKQKAIQVQIIHPTDVVETLSEVQDWLVDVGITGDQVDTLATVV
jgi:hypothetical protein